MEVDAAPMHVNDRKVKVKEIWEDDLDITAMVEAEPLPPVVEAAAAEEEKKQNGRGIVLGKNVHTICLEVTEPDANDDFTGDKEAYMASVLARYRKSLIERTKHHLGNQKFFFME